MLPPLSEPHLGFSGPSRDVSEYELPLNLPLNGLSLGVRLFLQMGYISMV